MTTLGSAISARFTISGSGVSRLAIEGELDAGSVVGLGAVAEWLQGTPQVVIDVSACRHIDPPARRAVFDVLRRLRASGSDVVLVDPAEAFAA